MISIVDGIIAINPNAEVSVKGLNIDTCEILWFEGTAEISKADIKTKMNELQAEYDSLAYARKRQLEYPSLNDFAEAYTEKEFGADSTKMDAYKIKYEKVRSDNPK